MADRGEHATHELNRLVRIALWLGVLALLVLVAFMFVQFRSLQREHLVSGRMPLLTSLKQAGTLQPRDASLIQSWMTFDYINYTFSLPPSYLQTTLSIQDPHYPHVAIEEYAEHAHASASSTLQAVQTAVESYIPTQ